VFGRSAQDAQDMPVPFDDMLVEEADAAFPPFPKGGNKKSGVWCPAFLLCNEVIR